MHMPKLYFQTLNVSSDDTFQLIPFRCQKINLKIDFVVTFIF